MKNKNAVKASLLSKAGDGFERLEKREQYLLLVAVPVTIMLVVFLLFIEPEINKTNRLAANAENLDKQLSLAKQSNQELLAQAQLDPNLALKQQIESLEAKLNRLNQQFEGELNQLVTPQAMPSLLEALFQEANGLSLLAMKSVAPEPIQLGDRVLQLQSKNKQQATQSNVPNIYRHGIEITFEGSFFDTRNFLSKAENLKWKLYWQDLSYSVGEHPKAVTQITLFTLSTSEAFIGVY